MFGENEGYEERMVSGLAFIVAARKELRAARRAARAWKACAKRKHIMLRQSQQAEFKMHSKLLRMEALVSRGSSEPKP